MDRTEELVRATQLFQSIDRSNSAQRAPEPSSFFVKSNRVSAELEQNAKLVQKMHTLTERKEFSNDPIVEMKKISTTFQGNISNIEKELSYLKKDTVGAGNGSSSEGGSAAQHRKLILEYLEKTMRRYVGSFKEAVKVYAANVEQRNKRVGSKYGQSGGLSNLTSENASKYAMFSAALPEPLVSGSAGGELRQRRGNAPTSSSTTDAAFVVSSAGDGANSEEAPLLGSAEGSVAAAEDAYESRKKYGKGGAATHTSAPIGSGAPWVGTSSSTGSSNSSGGGLYNRGKGNGASYFSLGGGAGMQQQAQQQKGRGSELDRHRLQQAEQAESTIAQMGQLFAQMATLVSEQSEVVQRIEDDVEAGLHETLEAQGHLERVYEITKGNRSLILKVFALLVFFIFLFLVWT